jgi:hypothetical protein
MNLKKLKLVILSGILGLTCLQVQAKETLTFITASSPGALSDTVLRKAAPHIEQRTGREVIIINAPGGEGMIAMTQFLSKPKDTTILAGSTLVGVVMAKTNMEKPLEPIAGLAYSDAVVISHTKSIYELTRKEQLLGAYNTPISSAYIDMFDKAFGTTTEKVGYKLISQGLVDISAKRVDYLITLANTDAVSNFPNTNIVYNFGSVFSWSALFMQEYNHDLAVKIQQAIKDTDFAGYSRYNKSTKEMRSVINKEMIMLKLKPIYSE